MAKRHAHASCIDDSSGADHAIELHVRVAADHERRIDPSKDRKQRLHGRGPNENLSVIAGSRVAEQHSSASAVIDGKRVGPALHHSHIVWLQLPRVPADDIAKRRGDTRIGAGVLGQHGRFPVALDELRWDIKPEETVKRFAGHRAWDNVPADDDFIDTGRTHVSQHCLEGR